MGGMLLLLFHIVLDHVSASNICCWRFAQRLPTATGQTSETVLLQHCAQKVPSAKHQQNPVGL